MTRKICVFLTVICFILSSMAVTSYGFDLLPKLTHTIIMAGVVKCVENGKEKPEAGAVVSVNLITDAAGSNFEDYTMPKPQTATTDANGLWVMVFSIPLGSVVMPDEFVGEIVPRCKTGKMEIRGDLEGVQNVGGFFDLMTGRAGNLADLIKKIVTGLLKIKLPGPPSSVKLVAYAGYFETTITCGKEIPSEQKEEKAVDVQPRQPEKPQEPVAPGHTEETPPAAPDNYGQPKESSRARAADITKEEPKAPPVDNYGKCVERCDPILDKLERLKKKLRELEQSESDNVKRERVELQRLKDALAENISKGKQQKYITPDGREHWGSPEFEEQYKTNGFTLVNGSERMSPNRQRFIDMLKNKIAAAEKRLKDAIAKDYRDKAAERNRIKDEMDKVLKEYEACVRSCDNFKLPGDKRNWRDFMPQKPYSDFEHNPKGGYFKPPLHPFSAPGKHPDVSRTPVPASEPSAIPVPTPSPVPAPKADTTKDTQPMPIGPAQPLVDPNGGFDKVPPVSTDYYTTHVPGQKYEAPPTLGVSDHSKGAETQGEKVQYKKVEGDRMAVDTAVLYKPTPTGMDVTAASVATGKGSDFRKWEIDKVRMDIDGETIKPDKEEKFYIDKESYYHSAAVVTFTAIGSQYRQCAGKAESGEVCPVTGQKKEASDRKGTIRDSIDSAGMAAGMGLLASQAKGSIPAKKSTFKLDRAQTEKLLAGKGALNTTANNEAAHQEQTVGMRLR